MKTIHLKAEVEPTPPNFVYIACIYIYVYIYIYRIHRALDNAPYNGGKIIDHYHRSLENRF
jgi:hypothetical protein